MAVLFMRPVCLLMVGLMVFVLSGCGGGSEPTAPEQDELSRYIEENPEILEEEAAMDEELSNEPERLD